MRTSSQYISDRECHVWQQAMTHCHGVSALHVDLPAALQALPSSRPLHKHVVSTLPWSQAPQPALPAASAWIDPLAWPFLPHRFDAVMLQWSAQTTLCQPRVLTEMDLCLADDGRILMHVSQAHLAQWCRSGMSQAQALGWRLQAQYWGDHRRWSFLPAPLARYWVSPWQRYAPVAQWCVQLWQKRTCRPIPMSEQKNLTPATWTSAWSTHQPRRTPLNRK